MQVIKWWISLVLICFVSGCSDSSDSVKKSEGVLVVKLPSKPKANPAFLNTSSLQSINEVAITELRRAGEYTGIDFAMLLVDELPEQISPEMAAAQLFDEWKVGAETQGKGVFFLFIEKEGVLKIEVGYELEDIFPDAFVGSFQETLKDYYRGEYFGDVVSNMIVTMMRRAQGEKTEIIMDNFVAELPPVQSDIMKKSTRYRSGGAGVTESDFVISKEKKLKNVILLSDKERLQYDKDLKVEVVLQRYLKSLQAGVNDPYLPLLTEGSQLMRLEYPQNAGFQRHAYNNFSGKYKIHKLGDLAAVRFERPDVMPILFRKDSRGNWLADITKSWAFSQASRDLKKMYPSLGDHAWMFAWENELRKPEVPVTPHPLAKGKSLDAEIVRFEKAIENQPELAANYFALADLLYFECYWIRDAMKLIEKGLTLEPANVLYRKRFINFAYRFPDMSRVAHHYEQIFQHDPGDYQNLRSYRNYLKNKRSANYDSKIKILTAAKKHLLVPVTPFVMSGSAGHFSKRTHYFDSTKSHLKATYEFRVDHRNERWSPVANIYLYDEARDKKFGIKLVRRLDSDKLVIWARISSTQKFKMFTVPLDKTMVMDCRWGRSGMFELFINNRFVQKIPVDMNPTQIRLNQSSGGGIFSLKVE